MSTGDTPPPPNEAAMLNAARQAALRRYLGIRAVRWRVATNGPLDLDRAMTYLHSVVDQLPPEQSGPIRTSIDAGTIRARRLLPRDGVVFESPQGRVFALEGLPPLIAPPAGAARTREQSEQEADGESEPASSDRP